MFNVGGGEMIVLFLVALVVLGPEKLPKAARQMGIIMGELRRYSNGFREELRVAMDEVLDTDVVNNPLTESARLSEAEQPDPDIHEVKAVAAPEAAVEPAPATEEAAPTPPTGTPPLRPEDLLREELPDREY